MEPKSHTVNLGSRIYKESYTVNWHINGFHLMPFIENYPVCGPWFMLGKNRQSTWSVLMAKEIRGGEKNVGFKLVRAEDETKWDMVTFSLGLKSDDGRFVSCIENQVVGKLSNNPYEFLTRPLESGMVGGPLENGACESCEASVKNTVNVGKVFDLIGLSGNKCANIKQDCILQRSSRVKDVVSFVNGSGEKSSTNTENGIRFESSAVEESSNFENSNSLKQLSATALLEIPERPEHLCERILQNGQVPLSSTNFSENDCHLVTELPNSNANKSDTQHLTPEELFQQENITVVCKIDYTYMMCDPLPDEDEPYQDEPYHSDEFPDFRDLYTSGKFSDITLKCEDVHFLCHKAILCTRSPLFREFLDKEASSNLAPNPDLIKETSSNLLPGPNLYKEASSDLLPDSNLNKEASSNLLPNLNLINETSSNLLPNMDRKESSDLVPKSNLVKEASSDLVLKLNLDLTTAKALLLYLYTGEFDNENIETKDECWRLLFAARKFGLPGLKSLCLEFLDEIRDEEECVMKKEYETNLGKKSSLLVCLEDDSKVSVGEQGPVINIGTETSSTSNKTGCLNFCFNYYIKSLGTM